MHIGLGTSSLLAFFFTYFNVVYSNIYLQPSEQDVGKFTDENFFITCHVDGDGSSAEWIGPEEARFSGSGRIQVQKFQDLKNTQLSLVFESVQKEDSGTYKCSDGHSNTITFNLVVYKAISFGDTPATQRAKEGENALITCNVHSDGHPVINWFYNGKSIVEDERHKKVKKGIEIFNVSRADSGTYKCSVMVIVEYATNVKEMGIAFHVWYLPEFIHEEESKVYSQVGVLTNLKCTASAVPAPKFQWMRHDNLIHNGSDHVILNNDTTSVLQLTLRDESEFGEYICIASNDVGNKQKVIVLEEGATPGSPQLKVISEDKGTLTLGLEAMQSDKSSVTGFKVEYALASGKWDQADLQEFKNGEQYLLSNVSYNTEYMLRASARNFAGYGDYSEVVTYTTQKLPYAPVVAKGHSVTTSLFLVIATSCVLGFLFV